MINITIFLLLLFFSLYINNNIIAKDDFHIDNDSKINLITKKNKYSIEDIDQNLNTDKYEGPQSAAEDIEIIYTEDAKLKARIYAKVSQQFKNKDAIYPQGIFVEFYNKEEDITGTLKADYVRFDYKKNIYKVTGNIIVINKKKEETLKTTELTWVPKDEKIFSKKETFVEIKTKDVSLIGMGIDAHQDMRNYKIQNLKGTIKIRKSKL
ncbi:MAG: LPS export ABC transporter periplasmic protein LptC [Bacteroidetes bacterium]|nr:LPS export ABC transporter periplasmic protein LptC [Bacteroidota bacterium]